MPLLEIKNVSKDFDGNVVLKNISFVLDEGKVLGLCGENGAGKSTLMNILFGMDVIHETGGFQGEVILDGESVSFKTPVEALNAGIGMVHQEFSLIPGFTAAENILLNREITKNNIVSSVLRSEKLKTVDMPAVFESAQQSIDALGIKLPAESVVSELPVGYKQFIEIAQEINKDNVKLLILDEPTAVLTESEAETLLHSIRSIAARGISIIFISHRLREVIEACDQVIVMRDGLIVADYPTDEIGEHPIGKIASWMTGRTVGESVADEARDLTKEKKIILSVKNLWVDMPGESVENATFDVYEGEIFGIAGLAGQGKLGIPNGIMGIYPSTGEVIFNGEPHELNNPRKAQQNGFAFVSEDRRGVGLLLDEPISWNICFNAMQIQGLGIKKYLGIPFRHEPTMNEVADKYIDELQIRCTGPQQKVSNLSGGNQQKICLAKAFCMEPKILLVSEPTRGIDVGAKELVLDALRRYNKERGTTIVIVSSELEELRSIADRIAVVTEGMVFDILPPSTKSAYFGLLMSGEKIEGEVI